MASKTQVGARSNDVLVEFSRDYSTNAWDGDQAPAITQLTLQNVKKFLSALPTDIPDPEFSAESDDGSISLEWYGGYRKIASVSINESNRLAFAAIQGTNISNGAYHFNNAPIPPAILTIIQEILA